jgi:CBS domain-containing protein
LREHPTDKTARDTFDFSDLNAYLLVVLGLASPAEDQREKWSDLAQRAKAQEPIPIREASVIAQKPPLATLSESYDLSKAIEIFGSGVHRILICKDGTEEIVGILSQLKLVKFLWENANSFPTLDQLYPVILRDLGVGTIQAISIK